MCKIPGKLIINISVQLGIDTYTVPSLTVNLSTFIVMSAKGDASTNIPTVYVSLDVPEKQDIILPVHVLRVGVHSSRCSIGHKIKGQKHTVIWQIFMHFLSMNQVLRKYYSAYLPFSFH